MKSPRCVDEISLDWLNKTLVQGGVIDREQITSLTMSDTEEPGATSVVKILNLEHDTGEAGIPGKVLIKFSSEIEPIRAGINAFNGYQREVDFYNGFGRDAGIRIPQCYLAEYDAEEGTCLLLMEYVEGTRQIDIHLGTVDEIELAVEQVAPFHAKWWGQQEVLGRQGIVDQDDPFLLSPRAEWVSKSLDIIYQSYRQQVGPTMISLLEFWLENLDAVTRVYRRMPRTLCHSDLHRRQILFPATDGGPFCVIDWQMVSIDGGACDLASLLNIGLLPEQRRQHETRLLEKYHRALVAHGVDGYAFDDLWTHYCLGVVRALVFKAQFFSMVGMEVQLAWWEENKLPGLDLWDLLYGWLTESVERHDILARLQRLCVSE